MRGALLGEAIRGKFKPFAVDLLERLRVASIETGFARDHPGIGEKRAAQSIVGIQPREKRLDRARAQAATHSSALRAERPRASAARAFPSWESNASNAGKFPSRSTITVSGCATVCASVSSSVNTSSGTS